MCVLLEGWFHNSGNRVADHFVLREQREYAVLDLLYGVRDTVRLMDLYRT